MRLIEKYTLHGIPILVHCRGGVGRAGLIACCWILKLGLCGWIDTYTSAPTFSVHPMETEGQLRRDTMQLVEKAIMVIRRRRSVKAIETFEQVLFLAEYVEYLRKCGSVSMSGFSGGHNDDE
jgi:protein-tyrosine phosphatase